MIYSNNLTLNLKQSTGTLPEYCEPAVGQDTRGGGGGASG